ncbi:MAG: RluA family pseudouridine synthase [Thermoanaerobaculia bacterium]
MPEITKKVKTDKEYPRLDLFLSLKFPEMSRSFIQKIIKRGNVKINNLIIDKPSKKLKENWEIEIRIPEIEKPEISPKPIPIKIIYEDEDIAVIEKPPFLSVHPGAGQSESTLVHGLLYHLKDLSSISGVERPGIVHRLDKNTSGLMVIAKNDLSHQNLSKQFSSRKVEKEYIALVYGIVKEDSFTVDAPIGRSRRDRKRMGLSSKGRKSITDFKVLKRYYPYATLLLCHPLTGRTHQIRVHLSSKGYPIVGDNLYAGKSKRKAPSLLKEFPRQVLHSSKLVFTHPSKDKKMVFSSEIPEDIQNLLQELEDIL